MKGLEATYLFGTQWTGMYATGVRLFYFRVKFDSLINVIPVRLDYVREVHVPINCIP